MARGKRRGWFVYPGGVGYPSRRRAKRVARIGGGQSGRVEGPRGCLPWLLVLLAIAAVAVLIFGLMRGSQT